MNTQIVTINTVEIPDSIAFAYADRSEIIAFMQGVIRAKTKLTSEQLRVVNYARARHAFRHGENMYLRDLAVLADTSVERIQHFVKKLCGEDRCPSDWLTSTQCGAILCNMMEM